MGLPYEDELQEMIAEEEEQLRFIASGGGICDAFPCEPYPIHVVFKGKKYTIIASSFIRAIEPFNQELCDILYRARKTLGDVFPPLGVVSQIITQAMVDTVDLYYDPDFPINEDDDDDES